MIAAIIIIFTLLVVLAVAGIVAYVLYSNTVREAKNYERGLKMIPLLIHLPPSTDDIEGGGRDERDVTEEAISEAQVMYNIVSSTATKGFKSRLYGQRHMSFELVSQGGLIHYYVVVPAVIEDVIRQAVSAAYPSARMEEVDEKNIFSQTGKMSGTIGGEFSLKKSFVYPIATYQESKRDATRAILNALSQGSREDGIAIQILLRPANAGWDRVSIEKAASIKKNKGVKNGLGVGGPQGLLEALWKPPQSTDETKPEDKQLTSLEQASIDAIEDKTKYPGYETLIRVVASSNTAARSQQLLKNVVSAFSMFNSPTNNGFKFTPARNIDELVTAYLFRFFPQTISQNVLNSVELATIFHLPDKNSIPTAQVKRQMVKQVDGPTELMNEGFLLGYNEFRGVKKPIRLSTNDRRRHTYIIGQTGTGKSVLLENLAYQDMMDGKGFAFVDPHGDTVESLLGKVPKERVEDIIYFNPGDMSHPIGLNMFEFDDPDQKDFLIQEGINMLYGLYDPGHTGIVGPRMEHIFRNCALLLMSDPQGGTFIDIPKLLVDEDFRKSKLRYVRDSQVMDFWTKEFPASQRSNEAGEVISWVVSKFGPFISNDAMRNIIGQTKSGFNIRDIMDNKKILLVNLSKGKLGELNSRLLGIIFIMKFQAAAMSRANIPEADRIDFSLYVDEFQNFATESFEVILSEARKYRLNLILGNQFLTQLTDKIREAVIGNVGTIISGRIGITDAEQLEKKFAPTFNAEDLAKLPNYQSITTAMISGVPSAPFTMSFIPPMGKANQQLSNALQELSAAKYGRPRKEVEAEIFRRLGQADIEKRQKIEELQKTQQGRLQLANNAQPNATSSQQHKTPTTGSSFLDDWLAKRKQLGGNSHATLSQANVPPVKPKLTTQHQPTSIPSPVQPQSQSHILQPAPISVSAQQPVSTQATNPRAIWVPHQDTTSQTPQASSANKPTPVELSRPTQQNVPPVVKSAPPIQPQRPQNRLEIQHSDDQNREVTLNLH